MAGPLAGAAVAGAITGAGNALVGGATLGQALGQGIVGGATGLLGGMLAGPLSGAIAGKLSSVIGSTATGIVANIATSAAVGGALGVGMSVMNGGDAWQGFVSGMRIGAITGAISSIVPAVINEIKTPKPSLPKAAEIKALPDSKYEFGKKNAANHFLKHARGLNHKNGEFTPLANKKADLPTTMKLSKYKEGAVKLFRPSDSGTASFIGKDGRLYMYHAGSNQFGVANPKTGAIITYFKPDDGWQFWINKTIEHTK